MRELLADVGLIRDLETQKVDPKTKEKRVGFVLELIRGLDRFVEQNPEKRLRDYLERVMLLPRMTGRKDVQQPSNPYDSP